MTDRFAAIERAVKPANAGYRYWVFAALCLCYLMSTFHRIAAAAIAGDLSSTFAIDAASLGLLTALYFYPYSAMQIPIGIMSDRLGTRLTIALFMAIAGVGALLFAAAPSYGWVLLGRVLVGAGVSAIYVPTIRTLTIWFHRNQFATFAGLLGASGQIGSLLATQPLAAMSQALGWRSAFFLVGGLTLAFALTGYAVVRNRPQDVGLPALVEEKVDPRSVPLMDTFRTALKNPNFRLLTVAFFCYGGASLSFQGLWAGPFLVDVFGLSKVSAGAMLTAVPLGMLISFPLAGRLSDRVLKSRIRAVTIGVLLLTFNWVFLTFGGRLLPLPVMYVIMFLFGIGNGFYMVATTAIMELFPVEIAGTATGLYNLSCFFGAGIFQQVLGMVIKTFPQSNGHYPAEAFRAAFLICLVAMAFASVCVLSVKEARPDKT